MPRAGAYLDSDLPESVTTIACAKCGRRGRYRRATLVARLGLDAPLPTLLNKLAYCRRHRNASDPCAVMFSR